MVNQPIQLPPTRPIEIPAWLFQSPAEAREHPLRFVWHMDVGGCFSIDSDEFIELIGPNAAALLGRTWPDIAAALALDPDGRVMKALASRESWSGITLDWPVDGGGSLPIELTGLAVCDGARSFGGFRGFGLCRDIDRLARLAAFRQQEEVGGAPQPQPLSSDIVSSDVLDAAASMAEPSSSPDLNKPAETAEQEQPSRDEPPQNVVLFRPLGEPKSCGLSPSENGAFNELARQLSARLERDHAASRDAPADPGVTDQVLEQTASPPSEPPHEPPPSHQPEWLAQPTPPARGDSQRDRSLLDLLPTGVLIYRLDRLLYANPAFLERMGHASLHALDQAGGLDALYVEAGVSHASSTSERGTPVTISAGQPSAAHASSIDARLFTISWDGDPALALIFTQTPTAAAVRPAAAEPLPAPTLVSPPAAVSHADAEELAAILDATTEGIIMFDGAGHIHQGNRSAEALFGYDGAALARCNLAELFALESQPVVFEYLESIKAAASLVDIECDVVGRGGSGGTIPLAMIMGRTRAEGPNFFAVFRDASQASQGESELRETRRLAEQTANAKADILARISHEVRSPLNAIIGLTDEIIGERFGPLGNERYAEYIKDLRAAGERVIALISDLNELSRIETGKLDLAFANQNLNELVESCVSAMQPQANRERIIVRTSLAQALPPVVADAHSLRQITMNLIGNSIHLANAGGQVIVSTALSDFGEVVLRVRDTGQGLNDDEVAAALEPFRTPAPSETVSDSSALSLSLTKALVEANRARFHIRSGGTGTLVEVVFPRALTRV